MNRWSRLVAAATASQPFGVRPSVVLLPIAAYHFVPDPFRLPRQFKGLRPHPLMVVAGDPAPSVLFGVELQP